MHESAAGTCRTISPTPHNIRPGWFHTHINLWGPSSLPGGVVHPSIPSPVLWSLGLPFSTAMGPFDRGGPDYRFLGDDFKRQRSRFVLAFPGWGASPGAFQQLMNKEERKNLAKQLGLFVPN